MTDGQFSMMPAFSAPTRSAYVRAAMLGGFAELVAAAGGDAAALAARAGIPERALRDLDMVISWTAVGHLMELAAQDLQKPSLALEWLAAAPAPLLNFGAVALIARFTDTIGEWCFHSRNYWHWHTNGSHAELLDTGANDVLTLRVDFSRLVPPSRHQVEYILGGVCALLRALAPGADRASSASASGMSGRATPGFTRRSFPARSIMDAPMTNWSTAALCTSTRSSCIRRCWRAGSPAMSRRGHGRFPTMTDRRAPGSRPPFRA
jgi:hypothetical protein